MSRSSRARTVSRVLVIEAGANAAVLVAKASVGWATGSIAVLGDTVHSLADLANNGLALLAVRVAASPPDREHPYGHAKFETLAVFALATLLAVLALELALGALRHGDREVVAPGWGLAVMGGVLAVNLGISFWETRWAHRLDSDILRADARHTFADALTTLVVIAGWQLAAAGYAWLDTAATLGVSALVLALAFGLFRRAIPILVDRSLAAPEEVSAVVDEVVGVHSTRRVRSQVSGGGRIDVVVGVDARLSTAESHAIADEIERALAERFAAHDVTVHVEPALDVSRREST